MEGNWETFLGYCLVIAFLVILRLFYFNRILGFILSKIIRIFTWRQYNAYIEIESIQFSPLAGRILFRNLKYRSINQSFIILKGHITCQYWLWNVRKEEHHNGDNNNDVEEPCRIVCHLDGVEWFVYNRTPAYEALKTIIERVGKEKMNSSNNSSDNLSNLTNIETTDCERGAFIFGNSKTPSVLVAEFSQAGGIYAAVKSRSTFDYYKRVLDLKFREPKIHLKPNNECSEDCIGIVSQNEEENGNLSGKSNLQYAGSTDKDGDIIFEYAKVPTILTCFLLEMTYYVDVAGKVPSEPILITNPDEIEIGNGDLSPEWGIDLVFENVQINYGPWADRQRVLLQNFFFPPLYRNSEPTKMLCPGQDRIHTSLKLLFQFAGTVTINIPTREASKMHSLSLNDENYYSEEDSNHNNQRQHGWIELKLGEESTINMTFPMVYTDKGYTNNFEIDFENFKTRTSVNDSEILNIQQAKIKCNLPTPLIWNGRRKWEFDIHLTDSKIFLLRDHITLFQDLTKDWTAGPSQDRLRFVPMEYEFKPRFTNFELYLYVNEQNIINEPADIDDNAFIIIKGPRICSNLIIPFLYYDQEITKIEFDVEVTKGNVLMSPHISQTLGAFLNDDCKDFGRVNNFTLYGTYQYYNSANPNNLESLSLTMKVASDPFEVYLTVIVEDGTILLPENLYNCDQSSTIHFHELQIELRNLDLYMDLDVTVSPLTWSLNSEPTTRRPTMKSRATREPINYLYIEDLNIYAHRLYGPLPLTATYVCNWDINIGVIFGSLKPSFLLNATSIANAFIYQFTDDENALPAEYAVPTYPDVTFLNFKVKEVDISIWGRDSGTQILLKEGLSIKFDDLANEKFNLKVVINLPDIIIRSLLLSSISSSNSDFINFKSEAENPWVEVASFECAFDVTLFHTTSELKQRFESQQEFLREQDQETLRVPFLYNYDPEEDLDGSNDHHIGSLYVPPMPTPLPDDIDGTSVLYNNESKNSSAVDISTSVPKKNILHFLGNDYGFYQNNNDDFEAQIGDDCISIISGSGVSISNTSFRTAPGFDSDDSDDSDDSIETVTHKEIIIGGELSPVGEVMSPPVPRSIPYRSYLRRYYKRTTNRLSAGTFKSSFLRPPRVSFSETKSPDIESSNSHFNSFFETKLDDLDSSDEILPEFSASTQKNEKNEKHAGIEEQTTIVFETTKNVKVVLTPIFLKIVVEFLESIKDEDWDIESMLDVMQTDYVRALTKIFLFKYTTTKFVAFIPRIHLQFIQDVLLPDDLNTTNEEHPGVRTRYDLTNTIMCAVADLILDQNLISGLVKFEDENFKCKDKSKNGFPSLKLIESRINLDLDSLKLNVRFATGSSTIGIFGIPDSLYEFKTTDPLNNEKVVLDLSLDNIRLKWIGCMEPNYFSFDIESLNVIFISQSAEIMTGAIYWWLVFAEDLSNIIKKFRKHRRQQLQYLIYYLAQYSESNHIEGDPLYLTCPSNVLRLGAPNLKIDNGWKLLGRIRHIKRLMKPEHLKALQNDLKDDFKLFSMDSRKMHERVVNIFSNWRDWEMDNISASRLFLRLFQQQTVNNKININEKIYRFLVKSSNIGKLYIGNIKISLFEESYKNSIEIGPISTCLEIRYQKDTLPSIEVTRPNTEPSSSTNEIEAQTYLGYLDVIFKIGIEQIDVNVNPDILAFVKHWLKVHRVFKSKFAALSSKNSLQENSFPSTTTIVLKHKSTGTITSMNDLKIPKYKDKKRKDEFNVKDLLSRLNIFGQGMFSLNTIMVTASAHNLTAKLQFNNINFSIWFNNPRALYSIDKQDLEGGSVNKSSVYPSSKGSGGKNLNILIFSGVGGIGNILATIEENKNTLLYIEFSQICTNIAISSLIPSRSKNKVDFGNFLLNNFLVFQSVTVKLPHSLLKLYHFVENWRTEKLPRYDFLYKKLLDEWEEQRKMTINSPKNSSPRLQEKNVNRNSFEIKFQFLMKKFSLKTHMLPSLGFHYDAWDFLVLLEQRNSHFGRNKINYSGQLIKQDIYFVTHQSKINQTQSEITSTSDDINDDHQQETAFTIPTIRTTGNIKPFENRKHHSSNINNIKKATTSTAMSKHSKLESVVTLNFVKLSLNVNIIDNLLTAQSLLGSEINDILDIFLFSSKKLKEIETSEKTKHSLTGISPPEDEKRLFYSLEISLRGLKISATCPSAVGFFETKILNGHITNFPLASISKKTKLQWKFSAQNFSLSLNHNTGVKQKEMVDDDIRKYRIAYIVIDLELKNKHDRLEFSSKKSKTNEKFFDPIEESYFLKLSKVHAVMQPIALGRLFDLYIYYSGELERRKEKKAAEIKKLTDNTLRIMRSLNVEIPKYKSKSKSLLDKKDLSLEILKFAVALPLDLQDELLSTSEISDIIDSPIDSQISAFILSTSKMYFNTRKWKSSYATLNDLRLQFVPNFDQGNELHFSSQFHKTQNRISFPEISFESNSTGTSRERLENFTAEANLNLSNLGSQSQQPKSKSGIDSPQENITNIINLCLKISFVAKSGRIKLYSKSYLAKHNNKKATSNKIPRISRTSSGSISSIPRLNLDGMSNYAQTNSDEMPGDHSIDEITIPGLSINTIYQAVLGQIFSPTNDLVEKRIHIELIIHPSSNRLFPSLVPFFKDIMDGLKIGIQKSSDKKAISVKESARGMNITCYLRLSRTTFELSCLPTSKVFCSLNWEEGNFLVSSNSAEGTQCLTCVGKIRGASGNIRHAFSPEDCLKAETKDISFNAILMSRRTEIISDDSISIIVELPQIMADLNIRHLQDLLMLKTIWLEQQLFRTINEEYINIDSRSSPFQFTTQDEVKPYSFYLLVKLKQLNLSSDLGQAVGKVRFKTKDIQVRTKNVPGIVKKLTASTDILDIKCEGRLMGYASMTGLTFSTFLRTLPRTVSDGPTCVTNLLFKTERIQSSLEYEYQKILILEMDPMEFRLTDNWKIVSLEKASVLVHADISIRQIQAIAVIKTIPIFLHMGNKLLALIEEKKSAATNVILESKRTSTNLHLHPHTFNPLASPISATSSTSVMTFKEVVVGGLIVHPVGKITIAMEKAHLTVYPNNFYDSDCVQIGFDGLLIDMKKFIEDERIHRELIVQLNAIALTKNTCKKLNIKDGKGLTSQQWFEHVKTSSKNIFTLPSTHLIMTTMQKMSTNLVDHKFEVDFRGKLDVALNFGLIRYLQELATLYKEQLKKNAVGLNYESPKTPIIAIGSNRSESPKSSPSSNVSGENQPFSSIIKETKISTSTDGGILKDGSSNSSKIDDGSEKEEKSKIEIKFNPIVPVKLEPQLRYLGDATPPLEWVGVQRAKVPGFVHTAITMNLDEIINHITSESFKAAQALL
ncbi:9921_t:CDS:10 [Diversispora eburnea]|uniref:9921_t:CDS:1 n=1 Tax=Diversispora eburnea TaxID=1213867 RepID=A0A9N8W3W5_9GLOM|nr:9921_t:CDS:10 [Diversispora eburnea]